MRTFSAIASALISLAAPAGAQAVSLDQACQTFASKLSAAQTAGDKQKAQTIYTEGSKRIASKFNGATPAVRKVVACAFDHAGAQGDDQGGVTARRSKLTSESG